MRVNISGDIIPNESKWVYDWLELDGYCPRDVHTALEKAAGQPVEVYLNSGGGDVFAGNEIYEALRDYQGDVTIHVIYAGSAASVIMCARKSVITPAGMVMVHNVSSAAWGDYHAMDKASDILQQANRALAAAYTAKSGRPEAEVLAMMDRETWLTAQQAVDAGLVDAISEGARLVAAAPGTLPPEVVERIRSTIKNPFQARHSKAVQAKLELMKLKGANDMNKEKYLNERKNLLDEAQALIDQGKLEEFEAKSKEIEALDERFDTEAKAAANLRALADSPCVTDLSAHSAEVKGGTVLASMGAAAGTDDLYDSVEYRQAFMSHVIKGEAIPEKFTAADANTKTTDIPAVIPTTVMERIVEKMESTGMILPLVTRTAYKGGVKIPASTVKPTAVWVAEGAGSDKQKKTTGSIDFAYNKLRCAISVSLETDVMALPVFEAAFIANVTEAMVKALEQAIVSGSGSGQPKGFLTEAPAAGQALTMTAAEKLSYQTLIDAEAALPLAYENGAVWFMTKKTFMAFAGMVDNNKQPIARVNHGINGRPERTLLGRSVVLNDYMASYADSMSAAGIIAALFNPKDYILNTNLNMTIKRYEDNDTDDQVTKAVMLADGKAVDVSSLVTITKAKPAT